MKWTLGVLGLGPPLLLACLVLAADDPSIRRAWELVDDYRFEDAEQLAREALSQAESQGNSSAEAAALDVLVAALSKGSQQATDETKELADRAVELNAQLYGEESAEYAKSVYRLGLVLQVHADREGAEAQLDRALAILESTLGPEDPEVARTLAALGRVYGRWRLEDGRVVLERSLAIRREAFGERHRETADSMSQLSYTLFFLEEKDEAQRYRVLALEIKEEWYGPDHPALALDLKWVGILHREKGELEEARPYFVRALEIEEKAYGKSHPSLTRTLTLIANLDSKSGNFEGANAAFERAIEIYGETLGMDHPRVAESMRAYGYHLFFAGDLDKATELAEQALEIRVAAMGPDESEVARIHWLLSGCARKRGDYVTSRYHVDRSLEICEQIFPPGHSWIAESLDVLALLLLEMGDYQGAKRALNQAVEIFKGEEEWNLAGFAAVYTDLAELYVATGDLAEAERYQLEAIPMWEQSRGAGHTDLAWAHGNLGDIYRQRGDWEQARLHFTQAVVIVEQRNGMTDVTLPRYLAPLGDVQMQLAEYDAAEASYERAHEIMRSHVGDGAPQTLVARQRLAVLYAGTGRIEDAFAEALAVERQGASHVAITLRSLPERQALRYARTRSSGLELMLAICDAEDQQQVQSTYDALIRGRANVLDELARRQRTVDASSDPEVVALAAQLERARAQLARLGIEQLSATQVEAHRVLVEQAAVDKERIEQELARRSSSYSEMLDLSDSGFERVTNARPTGVAIVSFVRFLDPLRQVHSYRTFVIPPDDSSPVLLPPIDAETLDASVEQWRGQVTTAGPPGALSFQWEQSYRQTAASLRRLLWDPVAPLMASAGTVLVVPDGSIHLVSFAALPDENDGYLLHSGPTFHVLSAERDIVASSNERELGAGMLAIGDPDFDAAGASYEPSATGTRNRGAHASCEDFSELRFERLDGTRAEVSELVTLWDASSTDLKNGATTLTGTEAREESVKSAAQGKRVVHFATHGFFLGQGCLGAATSLGVDSSGAGVGRYVDAGENPLLLSGLAMAGANLRDADDVRDEDGILTAEEVASLDLSGVEWAVLSACDTGVGPVQAGEGVFGLRRTFQVAGARTVITSLWPIDDQVTRLWMRELYGARFVDGLSTAESARRASQRTYETREQSGASTHPFYWAAFVAAGDWR